MVWNSECGVWCRVTTNVAIGVCDSATATGGKYLRELLAVSGEKRIEIHGSAKCRVHVAVAGVTACGIVHFRLW